jgi:hypothetical protein
VLWACERNESYPEELLVNHTGDLLVDHTGDLLVDHTGDSGITRIYYKSQEIEEKLFMHAIVSFHLVNEFLAGRPLETDFPERNEHCGALSYLPVNSLFESTVIKQKSW